MSDTEEDSDWVPPEISAIKSKSWGQEREQFRETLKLRFMEMLSKRKSNFFRRNEGQNPPDCGDFCEQNENRAPIKVPGSGNQKEPEAIHAKKSSRSGGGSNKGHRSGGQQNNRNYKGKNRR